MAVTTRQVRHLRGLINEIQFIEIDCYGKSTDKQSKLDEFTQTKLNLNKVLKELKRKIKTRN